MIQTTLEIKLEAEGEAVLKSAIDLFGPNEIFNRVYKFFQYKAPIIAGYIVQNQMSGQSIGRGTGALARSVWGSAELYGGLPAIRIGVFRENAVAYAAIQELGGVITPKNAKNLAIPVNDSLTPAGVKRWASPRDYPGKLRFVPFRRGIAAGALYDENELKLNRQQHLSLRDAKAAYLLVKKVELPARHYLLKGMQMYTPILLADLTAHLKDMLNGDRTPTA